MTKKAGGKQQRPVMPQMPPPDDPMAVARELLTARTRDGLFTLRAWRGGWMTWTGPRWTESEPAAIRAWAYRELEHAVYMMATPGGVVVPAPWNPNRRKMADLVEALAAVTYLPDFVSPPAWAGEDGGSVSAGEIVSCANGLLHVVTRELRPHTAAFFTQVAVPFGYDPEAPEPERWLKFLNDLWPGDADSIAALQEWFGYVLSGRTDLQKILLVVGPRRGGKGTIARVLAALVGAANVAGPTLASLETNFGLSPLLGKPLALVSDARLSGADSRKVVERLLSISGEDQLTIDRKYKEPWTGTLPTRLVIMSNELPAFGDASGAVATRFVTLILTRSWLGQENSRLTAELLAELPGILNWALDGLARLTATGVLTEPASSADAMTALADLVSPVAAFVRDRCSHGGEVQIAILYAAYRSWCEINGHRPGSKQVFGRDLRAVIPALRVRQPRDSEGRQADRWYAGVSLRERT
jgi:putative DNA primase/helicase